MNKGKLLLWSLFICIDFLIAAGVSELWTRIFIPVDNTCYYHDPVMGDRFCPNQETYGYVEKGYSNIFRSNSQGFHDIERTLQKKENTLRIHIYGDSLTTAEGVPIEYTIPSLIETYINRKQPSITVEVLNMASAEDSTVSQYLTYKYIGKYFTPDIVICYFMSDFHDNIFETHKRTRSPYFEINKNNELVFVPPQPVDDTGMLARIKKSSLLFRLLANKLLESRLYNEVNTLLEKIRFRLNPETTEDNANITDPREARKKVMREKAWPVTLRILQQFQTDVSKHGAHFILIDGRIITDEFGGVYRNKNLQEFCRVNNIPYIPVFQEYEQLRKGKERKKLFFRDGHPNIDGNRRLSAIVAEKLIPHLPIINTSIQLQQDAQ